MMEMDTVKRNLKLGVSEDCLDRISYLPESILTHIRDLLPTEDLVKTSFLSKKWKSLWSPFSVLDLDFQRFSENLRLNDHNKRFVEFVDRMIALHKGRDLEELRLSIDISQFEGYISQIDNWVRFVAASECKILQIDFFGEKKISDPHYWTLRHYSLPQCSFPHKSVENLDLYNCIFRPLKHVSFSSLKITFLCAVQLPDSSVNDLISSSPSLEKIVLVECYLPAHFKVHAPQSKLLRLEFVCCYSIKEDIQLFDINIPSLLYFTFGGKMVNKFTLNYPRNLISAKLNFYRDSHPAEEHVPNEKNIMLRSLLMELFDVKSLTMSRLCLQVLYPSNKQVLNVLLRGEGADDIFLPLRNLMRLNVHCSVHEISYLACLLLVSPNLEWIFLDLTLPWDDPDLSASYDFTKERLWTWSLFPSSRLNHLRIMEIMEVKGFVGRKYEMDLINAFLMNSPVLEKMIISMAVLKSRFAEVKQTGDRKQLKMLKAYQQKTIETLLALRRGSPSAKIILSDELLGDILF